MAKKAKSNSTMIIRAVLFGILLIAAIFLLLDRQARSKAGAAMAALEAKLPEDGNLEKDASTPTREQVHQLVGQEPDGESTKTAAELLETFTWSSPVRTYTLYVAYSRGGEPRLNRISLNKPLQ